MRKLTLVSLYTVVAIFLSLSLHASTPTIHVYVSKYRLIAQLESFRSGIPASIILAQGILESSYGNSNLANRSNNHFGIKWKGDKTVEYVYSYDDDYDKNGKHIPSRFIKYNSVEQSYQHHTDFLMQRSNYQSLFKYKSDDFVNWAYGLKECGYSTDKKYAVQLIHLIRRYKLNEYDIVQKKLRNVKPLNDTKSIVSIFSGKHINRFSFLKTQRDVLEQDMCESLATSLKIEIDNKSVLKKPLKPEKNTSKANAIKWAFIYCISTRLWLI